MGALARRHGIEGGGDRLGAKDHAGPAAVRVVVHAAVTADAPFAEIVCDELGQAAAQRTAGNGLRKRPGEEAREQRDDVDSQGHAGCSGAGGRGVRRTRLGRRRIRAAGLHRRNSGTGGPSAPLLPPAPIPRREAPARARLRHLLVETENLAIDDDAPVTGLELANHRAYAGHQDLASRAAAHLEHLALADAEYILHHAEHLAVERPNLRADRPRASRSCLPEGRPCPRHPPGTRRAAPLRRLRSGTSTNRTRKPGPVRRDHATVNASGGAFPVQPAATREAARVVRQDLQADRPAQAVHATYQRHDEALTAGGAITSGIC